MTSVPDDGLPAARDTIGRFRIGPDFIIFRSKNDPKGMGPLFLGSNTIKNRSALERAGYTAADAPPERDFDRYLPSPEGVEFSRKFRDANPEFFRRHEQAMVQRREVEIVLGVHRQVQRTIVAPRRQAQTETQNPQPTAPAAAQVPAASSGQTETQNPQPSPPPAAQVAPISPAQNQDNQPAQPRERSRTPEPQKRSRRETEAQQLGEVVMSLQGQTPAVRREQLTSHLRSVNGELAEARRKYRDPNEQKVVRLEAARKNLVRQIEALTRYSRLIPGNDNRPDDDPNPSDGTDDPQDGGPPNGTDPLPVGPVPDTGGSIIANPEVPENLPQTDVQSLNDESSGGDSSATPRPAISEGPRADPHLMARVESLIDDVNRRIREARNKFGPGRHQEIDDLEERRWELISARDAVRRGEIPAIFEAELLPPAPPPSPEIIDAEFKIVHPASGPAALTYSPSVQSKAPIKTPIDLTGFGTDGGSADVPGLKLKFNPDGQNGESEAVEPNFSEAAEIAPPPRVHLLGYEGPISRNSKRLLVTSPANSPDRFQLKDERVFPGSFQEAVLNPDLPGQPDEASEGDQTRMSDETAQHDPHEASLSPAGGDENQPHPDEELPESTGDDDGGNRKGKALPDASPVPPALQPSSPESVPGALRPEDRPAGIASLSEKIRIRKQMLRDKPSPGSKENLRAELQRWENELGVMKEMVARKSKTRVEKARELRGLGKSKKALASQDAVRLKAEIEELDRIIKHLKES